jgi:hypothetical protein
VGDEWVRGDRITRRLELSTDSRPVCYEWGDNDRIRVGSDDGIAVR